MPNDKLPALPPRPKDCFYVVDDHLDGRCRADVYMDAQDVRIVELLAEVERRKYFPAQLMVAGGPVVTQVAFDEMKELAAGKVAELGREIRELKLKLTEANRMIDIDATL